MKYVMTLLEFVDIDGIVDLNFIFTIHVHETRIQINIMIKF